MRALLLFVGLSALPFTLSPQQHEEHATAMQKEDLALKKYSIAVAAVGDTPDSVAASETILDHVESKLQSDAHIHLSGHRMAASRSELSNVSIWKYGREENADGVAVLQFERGTTGEKGRVYVWTATTFGPVPDKPALVETVDTGGLRVEQVSRIAAVMEQAASHGQEVALELYIYTVPAKSLFTVGRSPSQPTDEKGFGHWIGTQEEGLLVLAASNEPDYEPATQQVQVKGDPGQSIVRENIKFNLKKRPKRKSP
ncbi:MAG TPA: hypothetical protein VK302_06640 [Terriglobales bacterium]|nr:hypothetical protein [Terriglobales bacterium]